MVFRYKVADEDDGVVQPCDCLLQVDDVDPVALSEDELLHLRVPAARLMSKMHAGFEELFHCDRRNQIRLR